MPIDLTFLLDGFTTVAEQELKAIKAYVKKVSSSKADSLEFLQRAGIVDKKGELAKPYRN